MYHARKRDSEVALCRVGFEPNRVNAVYASLTSNIKNQRVAICTEKEPAYIRPVFDRLPGRSRTIENFQFAPFEIPIVGIRIQLPICGVSVPATVPFTDFPTSGQVPLEIEFHPLRKLRSLARIT